MNQAYFRYIYTFLCRSTSIGAGISSIPPFFSHPSIDSNLQVLPRKYPLRLGLLSGQNGQVDGVSSRVAQGFGIS